MAYLPDPECLSAALEEIKRIHREGGKQLSREEWLEPILRRYLARLITGPAVIRARQVGRPPRFGPHAPEVATFVRERRAWFHKHVRLPSARKKAMQTRREAGALTAAYIVVAALDVWQSGLEPRWLASRILQAMAARRDVTLPSDRQVRRVLRDPAVRAVLRQLAGPNRIMHM